MESASPAGALRGLAAELAPRRLVPALAAALAVGPIVVIVAISFATLVFSEPLAAYTGVGVGVGLALGGAAALAVVVALASSFRGMVATPQDSLGLLLGPFPERALWRPVVFEALAGADWGVVAGQFATVGPVVVIGVVALRRDVDLDRELSAAARAPRRHRGEVVMAFSLR